METKTYRVALIGAGMIANSAHIPAMLDMDGRFTLVGVQDVREEAGRFTARKQGIPYYEDAERMLNELKPDLAVVTTPNSSHAPLSIKALEMGVNVVCEKPIALTYKEAKTIYDTAARVNKLFMAAQTSRFSASVISLFEMIDMGILGDIYYCDAEVLRRRGVPKWGMFHMKEANGGGSFSDQSVHLIDTMVHANKAPRPLTVSGSAYAEIMPQGENLYVSNAEAGAYGAIRLKPGNTATGNLG
ncbi:MAG: Gfo/Idh/MocA family protein [Enterocloster bolteae]